MIPGAAIRDTIAVVLGGPAFAQRSWGQILWLRFLDLVRTVVAALYAPGVASAATFWTVAVAVAGILAAVLTRQAMRREQLGHGRSARAVAGRDPWADAEAAAGDGHYAEAAHRLYAGTTAALARAGYVRLHASKTPGDYLRDLRRATAAGSPGGARSSEHGAVVRAFAPFARGYQAVVYGPHAVDRTRYEALRRTARSVLDALARASSSDVPRAQRAV